MEIQQGGREEQDRGGPRTKGKEKLEKYMFQGLACLERAIKNNVEATGVASCCISRFRDGSPVPAHLVSAARYPGIVGKAPARPCAGSASSAWRRLAPGLGMPALPGSPDGAQWPVLSGLGQRGLPAPSTNRSGGQRH